MSAAGQHVRWLRTTKVGDNVRANWNGRANGQIQPAGTYRAVIHARDDVGNKAVVKGPRFGLSKQRR